MEQRSVSLILPATDETSSLEETVMRSSSALKGRNIQFLIVTSPKLTTPECLASISKLQSDYSSIETFDQTMPGIGGAIQEAFKKSRGEYTVLMASDLETDPAILPDLVRKLDEGYDIATATRWRGGMRFNGYHPVKLVLNFFFQTAFRVLYLTHLSDLTYAYRAYRTEIIKSIRWEESGFPFLFETIVKPLRLGYRRVAEVNAPWKARTEGVSHATAQQVIAYAKLGFRVRFMRQHHIRYTEPNNHE